MRFSEEELRKITLFAIEELGEKASPDLVKKILSKTIAAMESNVSGTKDKPASPDTGKVILTAFGLNKPGIIAGITAELSRCSCDIQDMSQKLMDDFFTLIMILDISTSHHDVKHIQDKMTNVAKELNVKIYLQHEDIFKSMHRI